MVNEPLNIYFCGSIRGGRADQQLYKELISFLQTFGTVLTTHVGDKDLSADQKLSSREIYERDMKWMDVADIVVAEVSTPSHGVGFEIARAVSLSKRILCLFLKNNERNLSAIVSGCSELKVVEYSKLDDAKSEIINFLNEKY